MRYYETKMTERIGYDFYCDIALRIVEARKKKEWTAEQLAKETGMSVSLLSRIECVNIKSKLPVLEKLSLHLDVTVNWLIDAEIDSQIGECLYLIWKEGSVYKDYQYSTSKRLAFLQFEAMLNQHGVRFIEARERAFVKLVGVPVTPQELMDRYGKLRTDEQPIEKD